MAVASGVHDVVLVIGVEKMRDKSTEEGLLSRAAAGHPIFTRGETAPVLFAPFATRHMAEYGTTREMLASVAVKNHYNGARDPYAHFQNEITVDDVLKSPPVCHPLHLLDCCPQTDGAAAVLLAVAGAAGWLWQRRRILSRLDRCGRAWNSNRKGTCVRCRPCSPRYRKTSIRMGQSL
jgi:acetyl-CoA C-acetyltransferase